MFVERFIEFDKIKAYRYAMAVSDATVIGQTVTDGQVNCYYCRLNYSSAVFVPRRVSSEIHVTDEPVSILLR